MEEGGEAKSAAILLSGRALEKEMGFRRSIMLIGGKGRVTREKYLRPSIRGGGYLGKKEN